MKRAEIYNDGSISYMKMCDNCMYAYDERGYTYCSVVHHYVAEGNCCERYVRGREGKKI